MCVCVSTCLLVVLISFVLTEKEPCMVAGDSMKENVVNKGLFRILELYVSVFLVGFFFFNFQGILDLQIFFFLI